MALGMQQVFQGTPYVNGTASGILIASDLELSFWGGVDPSTGEIIDRFHPLSGQLLKDAVLAIPSGRGSCGGSVIMLELILNGLGPKALIFERCEEIITLGVIVADELFNQTVPVVTIKPEDFRQVRMWSGKTVYIAGDQVSDGKLDLSTPDRDADPGTDMKAPNVELSDFDRATLDGANGDAARLAMRVIVRMARMMKAPELMDVSQAHVDGAWFGPGSVAFGKRMRDLGGKFRVPTTINSINIDQRRWQSLGIDTQFGTACDELAGAFVEMGGKVSFTCAPYLLESAPKRSDPIAWGESNAVTYANSVLGARTLKFSNMFECLIALTGRAPKSGVYLDKNRLASVWIRVQVPEDADDSFWPILGYSVGAIAKHRIPVITGVEGLGPSSDDLKAFSAAFATSSSAPMFHMVKLTPEAPTLETVCPDGIPPEVTADLGRKELESCWDEFNHGSSPRQVGLISLGNPHFSCREIERLARLCRGRIKHKDVAIIVTCGRAQHSLATQAGHVHELEKFGVQFLTDTCWCFITEPVIPKSTPVIMTNSGKFIHYGPGLTGRAFCFGSLQMCVDAACSGESTGTPPAWLQAARTA
ncbi:hypothetical protein P170DRAFT_475567 [Aspergillus steynii IBT 23096]|uniref:DUF521 domain protein n=1 Tax=Aspergillus steynii IBT 23096 TaxID=1392250 RepID=A0A2I2G8R0_9EURO|nr:uncharacterized protein P170DRAFT_475567 [Aspergillus steynii IBT 23096]PLB49265.1 hypothetical protein P170DRAFT_475567 [Aspergillus steynii IBT 23096]